MNGIVAVTVNAWSMSSTVALTAGAAGGVRVELTVTVDEADDVNISGVDALSVTLSSNAYVSPAINVPAAMLHVCVEWAEAPSPLPTSH